mgnify:CR=1 FL=1
MKRFLVLLSLVVLTNIPFSCVDDCGPFNPMESKITELYVLVGSLTSSGFIATKSTDFELAAIQIGIADLDYTEVMASIARPRFSFFNAAIACSPPYLNQLRQLNQWSSPLNQLCMLKGMNSCQVNN